MQPNVDRIYIHNEMKRQMPKCKRCRQQMMRQNDVIVGTKSHKDIYNDFFWLLNKLFKSLNKKYVITTHLKDIESCSESRNNQ